MLLSFLGCGKGTTPDSGASQVLPSGDSDPEFERMLANEEPVGLQVVGKGGYDQTREFLLGYVVLVDCWATWCEPCVAHFPETMALGKKYAEQGLRIMTLSLDDPGEKEKVLAFLKEQDSQHDNLLSRWGTGTETTETFGIRGGVPFYKLYDRDGQLRFEFSGDPTGLENVQPIEEIESRVKELLAEDA
jgi:thiol-disulfide isomerase/thioredoxin